MAACRLRGWGTSQAPGCSQQVLCITLPDARSLPRGSWHSAPKMPNAPRKVLRVGSCLPAQGAQNECLNSWAPLPHLPMEVANGSRAETFGGAGRSPKNEQSCEPHSDRTCLPVLGITKYSLLLFYPPDRMLPGSSGQHLAWGTKKSFSAAAALP